MAKNESTKPAPPADDQSITVKGTPRFKDENELTDHEIVQRRTPDTAGRDPWPADGRFHRVFNIQKPVVSDPNLQDDATSDWNSSDHDAMHEANKVAVLQEALNLGLHPRAEATFDGAGPVNKWTGTCALTYSVEVVPASSEEPEAAASVVVPGNAIAAQGGSTLPDKAK